MLRRKAMPTELTKDLIEQAFDELGRVAAVEGLVVEMAVFGGSCLVLASDIRNASGDVDAVFLSDSKVMRRLADRVGKKLGLPQDWLNEGVRRLAPPLGNPRPALSLLGEYPKDAKTAIGLRVLVPTASYMLAMKILANRAEQDVSKLKSDASDAIALMKVTGLTTFDDLANLLRECYPNIPGITPTSLLPRIRIKLESLVDEYKNTGIDKPTWNAGIGPPVGSGG
jgi:hypothetical protein